ncbi:MAG TPA: inosine/xanthosine triphosphatase [Candidatus Aenigmarchaeota archaeon]|nr:inosine/xanthosine triphosphatase [Candidatus Aenigmarchaeota archaeon]
MKVIVGSGNPVKIEAVEDAFSKVFGDVEVVGKKVESGVSPQPIGEETFRGARNRALKLREMERGDFFVGVESGVINLFSKWFNFAVVCVMDKEGRIGYGTSPLFPLPEQVVKQLLRGRELGDVMDEIEGKKGVKYREGAIGFFTNGAMDRKELMEKGVICALIPFLHEEMF